MAMTMQLPLDVPTAITHLKRADKQLKRLIERSPMFEVSLEKLSSPFEGLMRSIVYQQLSGKAAATIYGRVKRLYPRRRKLHPQDVLDTPDEALRAAGMSYAKIAGAKDLAAKTLDGTVPNMAKLNKLSDQEIIDRLVTVRGIGKWSVEMLLIFRMGRADVLPIDDLGVRRGVQLTYGLAEMPKPKEVVAYGEPWRPYRTVGSWYMWRATEV
jgi:DNA-3-methyladenine glycosylase II